MAARPGSRGAARASVVASRGMPPLSETQALTAIEGPDQKHLKQIKLALDNPLTLTAHAKSWFTRFDQNRDGLLDVAELGKLCERLNADMRIPPVDQSTVAACLKKFDTNSDGLLSMDEFQKFYSILLLKVREHYGGLRVRREFFLDKRHGKPNDHYTVTKMLGQGSFGVAELVVDKKTKQPRVLKTINKAKAQMPFEELEQEIRNMKQLDHPHVIKLFEYYEDFNNIYIVMESADGGELLKVIEENYARGQRLNEAWLATVMRQVLQALAYCHARGVMHKDIKAENIMLLNKAHAASGVPSLSDAPHAVLIDFGLAELFASHTQQRSSICSGTPYTMAPEVWLAADGRATVGMKCDIYSLGVVFFQLLTGDFPLMGKTCEPSEWLALIRRGPDWSKMRYASKEAADLCKQMMQQDEARRPDSQACLRHPWFAIAPERMTAKLSEEQTQALCRYRQMSTFQRAVLLQIATQIRAIEIPMVNQVFASLDIEKRGYLDRSQCATGLQRLGLPSALAADTAVALDTDGDGRVDYTELVAGVLSMFSDRLDQQLWKEFGALDRDGSGSLDASEVRALLSTGELHHLGLMPDNTDVDVVMRQLDADQSGKITYEEFRNFFLPPGVNSAAQPPQGRGPARR